ncbi:DNA topoisomerase I [Candidatus Gottesmanbacteria bacterium RIFCSPLOWO2_01_FULL_40_10]|nr:MAG: DNA topoisomerase I [Candidatus Gottesmanbacteria bacterium RIFCSPLOWO2_01_FULL_40_10]
MSQLVIVESPTKARTLSRFLGKDYRIEATMGHVRDLPAKKLGIEIKEVKNGENSKYSFLPDYLIIPDRKKGVSQLKKTAASFSGIILATDPDREGEAIAYHIKEILLKDTKVKKNAPDFTRIVFHEITSNAINRALEDPKDIDKPLVEAQQARRLLDRLVGYKLSPLLWNKLGKRWLSAGRVQTVAVRLIVEREREIKAFVSKEYWHIDVEFQGEKDKFIARLVEIDGNKTEVNDKKEADKVIAQLEKSNYKILDINTREVRRSPPPAFTTSTLQQTASNRFGWSAKKTMRAAQNLYEEGFITYHRTDSTNLAMESIIQARKFIEQNLGEDYLPEKIRIYKTKSKVAQEAHEAIRPTQIATVSPTDARNLTGIAGLKLLPETTGRDSQLLYSLIWRRFLACQMSDALFNQTTITVEGHYKGKPKNMEFLLRTGAQELKFEGWLKLYDKKVNDSEEKAKENGELSRIPQVTAGEKLEFLNCLPQQKFTEPPPRYNEASLIKTLEEKGIGRPSTYAPIISTIQDRKYVEKIEKRFYPTDLGFAVCDFLVKYFPEIFEVTFTAGMEDRLDEIANGKTFLQEVLNDFYSPFKKRMDEVYRQADKVKVDLGSTDEKCPKCGSPLVIRMSRYGKFLACSTYPDCTFTRNILEKTGITCPNCGGEIVIKKTRKGKQFYGCANYPKCKFAAWKKEDIKQN